MRKDEGMSRVRFDLGDRLAVVPIELVGSWKVLLPAVLLAAVTGALERRGVDARVLLDAAPFLLAVLAGAALTPALLPFLPFRSFSLKGAAVGLAATAAWVAATGMTGWDAAFVLLAGTAVCSFLAINFTGASTYTSQSGVLREMKAALPVLIAATVLGVAARLVGVARAFLS
jgi:acetyl-CoA decarbonylase/synthase complex subunit gamma